MRASVAIGFEPSIAGFDLRAFEGGVLESIQTHILPLLSLSPLIFPDLKRDLIVFGATLSRAEASAKDIRTSIFETFY